MYLSDWWIQESMFVKTRDAGRGECAKSSLRRGRRQLVCLMTMIGVWKVGGIRTRPVLAPSSAACVEITAS